MIHQGRKRQGTAPGPCPSEVIFGSLFVALFPWALQIIRKSHGLLHWLSSNKGIEAALNGRWLYRFVDVGEFYLLVMSKYWKLSFMAGCSSKHGDIFHNLCGCLPEGIHERLSWFVKIYASIKCKRYWPLNRCEVMFRSCFARRRPPAERGVASLLDLPQRQNLGTQQPIYTISHRIVKYELVYLLSTNYCSTGMNWYHYQWCFLVIVYQWVESYKTR